MTNLIEQATRTIEKHGMLDGGETVLAAVSGGPDSLAMLTVLCDLRDEYDLRLHVFHLDHMMRGEASRADAEFVRKEAEKLGLPATLMEADAPAYIEANKTSPEDGARQVRRQLLLQVADEINADKIALGHNADDVIETFIMRLIRGAGLDGLRSIMPVNGKIIRPLIETRRADIEEFCRERKLNPRHDETNLDTNIFRNKVRSQLLPLLTNEYNPAFREELLREIDTIRTDVSYLERTAQSAALKIIDKFPGEIRIDRKGFLEQPGAIQRRIIRQAAEYLCGQPQPLGFVHVRDFISNTIRGMNGSAMDLPGGLTGHREYDTIVLRNQNAPKPEKRWDWQPVQLLVPGVTDVGDGDLSVEASLEEPVFPVSGAGSDTAFFDADSVGTRFFVRPVMAGDAIKPLGMEGHKKISDIFTDDKVPRAARDKAVVIETGGAVVWLVGHRTSEYCKITDKTKRVIRLIVSRGDA